jgi:hypothetical protein
MFTDQSCGYIKLIDVYDHVPLSGNRHTAFILFYCFKHDNLVGFPDENYALAKNEGTDQTKQMLAEILEKARDTMWRWRFDTIWKTPGKWHMFIHDIFVDYIPLLWGHRSLPWREFGSVKRK